jgi:oligoribonuclease NrnB/cAMP/cGMP phosphodiesterase (DHH superfamily)
VEVKSYFFLIRPDGSLSSYCIDLPGTVVISDLSLNSKDEAEAIGESCLNAKQYGWEIVWLDHHYWSEEMIKRVQSFAKLILSTEHEQKCAAELVYHQFAKGRWPRKYLLKGQMH